MSNKQISEPELNEVAIMWELYEQPNLTREVSHAGSPSSESKYPIKGSKNYQIIGYGFSD